MPQISLEFVRKVSDKIDSLPDEKLEALTERLGDEQPVLLAYLFEMGGEDFDEDDRSIMVYYGLFVWWVFDQYDPKIFHLKLEKLEEVGRLSDSYFDPSLSNKDFEDFYELVQENTSHPFLLEEVFESLKAEELEKEENRNFILLFLNVLMECWCLDENT